MLIGFSTSTGTVMASSHWGEQGVVKQVQRPLENSYERVFHESGVASFILPLYDPAVARQFDQPLLERAIGVIYRPETERMSHYFQAHLSQQFDALIHFEETRAVEPISKQVQSRVDARRAA